MIRFSLVVILIYLCVSLPPSAALAFVLLKAARHPAPSRLSEELTGHE